VSTDISQLLLINAFKSKLVVKSMPGRRGTLRSEMSALSAISPSQALIVIFRKAATKWLCMDYVITSMAIK
jgi:hypothetical protein